MRRWWSYLRAVAFVVVVALACRADNFEPSAPTAPRPTRPRFSITRTDTLYPVEDSWVRSAPKGENRGANDSLRTKTTTTNTDTNRTVLRFDQAAIAAEIGAGTLVSAKLQLTVKASGSYAEGNDVAIHRMTMGWTEGGVTWKCGTDLNLANNTHECPTTAWAMSGSGTVPYVNTPTAQLHLESGATGRIRFDVTADVATFLGGTTNYGWLLKLADEGRDQRVSYWSREAASERPRLILTVTEPDTVPPPAPDSILYPVADAFLRAAPPNGTHGGYDSLRAVAPSVSDTNRSVIRFDQAAIAAYVAGRPLTSATLQLTVKASASSPQGNDVAVHRMTMPWVEHAVTWKCGEDFDDTNTDPNCPDTRWLMQGSGAYPNPYIATPTTQLNLTSGQTGVVQFDVTADVQAFLNGTPNQGWLLKILDESRAQRVSFWAREATAKPRLVLSVAADTSRPELLEDITWPTGSPLIVTSTVNPNYQYYRNLFFVGFNSAASGTTVRNFLSHYGATIIGGSAHATSVPLYVVQVADPGATYGAVDALVQDMGSQPGIATVVKLPYGELPGMRSRYPIDADLTPSRDFWHHPTYAFTKPYHAIRAPFAWGCETGTYGGTPVKIGMLDGLFDSVPDDLKASVTRIRRPFPQHRMKQSSSFYSGSINHGSSVAGILTAQGDNGQGIPGMIWKSDLSVYTLGYRDTTVVNNFHQFDYAFSDAAANDIRVMNLSLGSGEPADTGVVGAYRRTFEAYLNSGTKRLIVVATGNDSLTMSFAALSTTTDPKLYASDRALAQLHENPVYRSKILFVTGTVSGTGQRWPGANVWTGDTIIAAPATDFAVLGYSQPIFYGDTGTSLAAPLVTGVAAQLWTMDPTLTAAEVKQYILDGARVDRSDPASAQSITPSNIGVAGIYQLDAFGSLSKMSRERANVPICGYTVSSGGFTGSVRLEKGTGPSDTVIHLIRSGITARPSVAPGGRRISAWTQYDSVTRTSGSIEINHLGQRLSSLPGVYWTENTERYIVRPRVEADVHPPYVLLDLLTHSYVYLSTTPRLANPSGIPESLTVDQRQIGISATGEHVAFVGRDASNERLYLKPLDNRPSQLVATFPRCSFPCSSGVDDIAFSHDGRTMIVAVGTTIFGSSIDSELYSFSIQDVNGAVTIAPLQVLARPGVRLDDLGFTSDDARILSTEEGMSGSSTYVERAAANLSIVARSVSMSSNHPWDRMAPLRRKPGS